MLVLKVPVRAFWLISSTNTILLFSICVVHRTFSMDQYLIIFPVCIELVGDKLLSFWKFLEVFFPDNMLYKLS